MPRQPRKRSNTGVYHVMLRGIDKRNIFIDTEDREMFLYKLFKVKEHVKFQLYGYCIMDNHVHLLINESEEIGITVKRLAVGYVQWHNSKYGRSGHLFQNRFHSEAVETESYLKTVLRYIHQNPIKANIVRKVNDYNWSSYKDYIISYGNKKTSVDSEYMKSYFPSVEEFQNFMNNDNDDECLEYDDRQRHTDQGMKALIEEDYGFKINTIDKFPLYQRNQFIRMIYRETNTNIRQLSRVMGLGKRIVEMAIKQQDS